MAVMLIALACLAVAAALLYLASTWKFNYWKKKRVPYAKPTPLLGNYGDYILMKKYNGQVAQKICQAFPGEPYFGAYYGTEPTLFVQNPDLIKLILTKDFSYFHGREITNYTDREIVTRNMFFTQGDAWKVMRQNMSPLFTSAKMKNMFHLIEKVVHEFEDLLDREMKVSDVHEIRALMARYTMTTISSCGFGIDTKTLEGNIERNPFRNIGDKIFDYSNIRGLFTIIRGIWPGIFYGLGLKIFPMEIANFFHNLLTDVLKGRDYKPTKRNDFVDLVLNMKKNKYITSDSMSNPGEKVTMEVDDEFLTAQCALFFAAGFETSSTTVSMTAYELAKDAANQKRAIDEVDDYLRRHEGKIGYDCVNELPFLEACIDEALRLYPVLGLLTREVMQDYTLPDGVRLDKGVRVHLPVYHLHHNPENFPDPEQFRPERFLGDAKERIKPYTYLPFGEGPRVCIGMRFAKMQMLPGLMTILKTFRLELARGTPRSLQFEPRSFVAQATGSVNLKFVRRDEWEQNVYAK